MEIIESSPTGVKTKLDFSKPFEGHYLTEFPLETAGEMTKVTWRMSGPNAFMSKVMQVFMDMDSMIGSQFESGLAKLKLVAEKN